MPLAITAVTPPNMHIGTLVAATLAGLGGLGALAAKTGGVPALPAALRVTYWSALAMGSTVAIGSAFSAIV